MRRIEEEKSWNNKIQFSLFVISDNHANILKKNVLFLFDFF